MYRPPAGTRLYVIGDVHGRADLLAQLHDMILADAAAAPEPRKVAVHLGDYVDRGMESRAVVDRLVRAPLSTRDAAFEDVFLAGNHEAMMLGFLDDPAEGPLWLMNGGAETLLSYGVDAVAELWMPQDLHLLSDALRAALPPPHLRFLRGLARWHREGGYLMVHAGIRPGVPIEQQTPHDLMWIRGEFLDSDVDHGALVVHGHTIAERPQLRTNRIGIDTGAKFTNRLTCLVAHGAELRFLQT